MRLEHKTALVLGGTRGIGRGIVEAFAAEGAFVVIVGRDGNVGEALAAALRDRGRSAEFQRCDVRERHRLEQVMNAVTSRHGSLDVLVNNAGYAVGRALLDSTEADYDELFDLNVKATFFAMKLAADRMAETGGGSIINIASTAATRGYRNRALYCGTKGAVLLMSKSAALDMAPLSVRINCISPGTIDTDLLREIHFAGQNDQDHLVAELGTMNPLGRVGSVDEIGVAAVYFASDESAWVTGANLVIDGGYSI